MTTIASPASPLPIAARTGLLLGRRYRRGEPIENWYQQPAAVRARLIACGAVITDPAAMPSALEDAEGRQADLGRQLANAKQRAADSVQRIEDHEKRLEQLSVALEAERARRPQLAADRRAADAQVSELTAELERATAVVARLRGAA